MAEKNSSSGIRTELREIWDSRNILRSLVSKNLFGRYRNSALGFAWHFIMPLMMLAVYYIVFTSIRTSDISYFWVFLASGIFPFNFMTSNLAGGAGTITGGAGMVKKMYFPREILVLAHVLSSFIIMLLGYVAVLVIVALAGFPLNLKTLLVLPAILVLSAVFVTGYVLFFSALTVYVRDVQYALSSITMVLFFMTPMYFPATSVSGVLSKLIWFNPFTYFIEAFHNLVYSGAIPELKILLMCVVVPIISVTIGWIVFRRLRGGFAERL